MSVPPPPPPPGATPPASASSATSTATSATPPVSPSPAPAAGASGALVVGFVLVSLNSRVAFGQIGPLAPVVGWGPGTVALLGLLPPLVMGACAPLARGARVRLGEERGLLAASVVVLVGALLRPLGIGGLVAGTIVLSAGIAVVNVLVPVLVRARFSHRLAGPMTACTPSRWAADRPSPWP